MHEPLAIERRLNVDRIVATEEQQLCEEVCGFILERLSHGSLGSFSDPTATGAAPPESR